MLNYQGETRNRMVGMGNTDALRSPIGSVVMKNDLQKNKSKEKIVVKGTYISRDIIELLYEMSLEELLEASILIQKGIKGEKVIKVNSQRAKKYAKEILRLYSRSVTKSKAESMIHKLNVRIIKLNKKTTDIKKSRQLYHKLMSGE